jgi:hypothetical protein
MRIDHISESHPTLNATKKKAQKKERKEQNIKETLHPRDTKKNKTKAKNCIEKKVKRFAVAAPQFSGQRTVKEKKRKALATLKKNSQNFATFAATYFLSRISFFTGFLFLVGYFVAFCCGKFLCVLRLKGIRAPKGICARASKFAGI